VKANDRGAFQFDGVATGKYDVRATAGPLMSQAVDVSIVGTSEAELRAPLVLALPKRLHVTISPALDPAGKPWSVELAAIDTVANYRRTVRTSDADFSGTWTADGIVPGSYWVRVRRGPQASWYLKELDVMEDADVTIDIAQARVSGRVTRAGKSVRGVLWFGGDRSAVSIPVRTETDGTFATVLPNVEHDTWAEVDVVADDPPLRRALFNVRLARKPDVTDEYELNVDLPNRGIFGQVSDGTAPAKDATVYLASDDLQRLVDVQTRADGGYGFDGLEPGGYTVRGVARDRQSKSVHVNLSEGNQVETVDLALEGLGDLRGRVVSAGRPIGGARVWVIPADRGAAAAAPTETSVDGTFTITIPAGARHVALVAAAPGFGLSFGDFGLAANDIELPITPDAAILELNTTDTQEQFDRGLLPVLIHRGTFVPVALAAGVSGTAQTADVGKVRRTTVAVEPGEYALCYARQINAGGETSIQTEPCVTGTALAGTVLNLEVAKKR